jgi:transposase
LDVQKKTLAAQERNEPERQAFRDQIATLDARRLVVVDECASHIGMIPGYGRAPRGQRRWGTKRRNYGKNMSIVACLTLNGMGPTMTLEGAIDTAAFEAYVQHCLLPFLQPGQIVLMDNLSSHKGSRIEPLIASRGCSVLYIPAYSPDLTPIEEAFSKIKTFLKRASAQTVDTLLDAISAALPIVSISDAFGFFHHAGFTLPAQSL